MFAIVQPWRRVMAVGCSHGDLAHPVAKAQALEVRRRFNPQVRFELGDLVDTAAFRSGAAGTRDEAHSPRDDQAAALEWLRSYEPTHLAWGNHDWRLFDLQDHPKAIVSELAQRMWGELESECRGLHCATVPYHIRKGWHWLGGVAWGHGFMYNQQAVRDHAEMVGGPVVMAHLHTPQVVPGRTIKDSASYCVGALADDDLLTYGLRRRQSLSHGHGIVYGEISDHQAHLHLLRAPNGEPFHIPSWI